MDIQSFGQCEEEIIELLKPIYSMTDARNYSAAQVDSNVQELSLVPLLGDPSLYVKRNDEDLDDLLGTYIDDGCLGGQEEM